MLNFQPSSEEATFAEHPMPFLLRWVLVTAAGWVLGLLLSLLLLILGVNLAFVLHSNFILLLILLLMGAVVGAMVGGFQQFFFMRFSGGVDWRYVGFSALGGTVGAVPAVIASNIFANVWFLSVIAVGLALAAPIAAAQWVGQRRYEALKLSLPPFPVWLASHAVGGSVCGVVAFAGTWLVGGSFGALGLLPCCCLGSVIFGVVTGLTVMQYQPPDESENAPEAPL